MVTFDTPRPLVTLRHILGENPTGLGVYASQCCTWLEEAYGCSTIAHARPSQTTAPILIRSPPEIVLGVGLLGSIRRVCWSFFVSHSLKRHIVYAGSHHGIPFSNQIITIHDLIPLHFPRQALLQSLYFRLVLPSLAKRAVFVATVSDTVRAQLVDELGVPAELVRTIPNWIDCNAYQRRSFESTQKALGLLNQSRRPFLLVVGARYPHKNITELLENHGAWRDRFDLVIVSAAGPYARTISEVSRRLGIESSVNVRGYVASDELDRLYYDCAALVYPSHDEGFGIPLLEAAARGVPIVASDIKVHREVMADGAIFVRLGDAISWRSSFESLAATEHLRTVLNRAHERAKYYSPQRARQALLDCFNSLSVRTLAPGID